MLVPLNGLLSNCCSLIERMMYERALAVASDLIWLGDVVAQCADIYWTLVRLSIAGHKTCNSGIKSYNIDFQTYCRELRVATLHISRDKPFKIIYVDLVLDIHYL